MTDNTFPSSGSFGIALANGWIIRPVEVDGAIQLCDMFDPDGTWHGSRRTIEQCHAMVEQLDDPC